MKQAIPALAAMLIFGLAACHQKSNEQAAPAPDQAQLQAQAEAQAAAMAHQHEQDTPAPTPAAEVPPTVAVESRTVEYGKSGKQALSGYLSQPAKLAGAAPGVILFHEWWGLNDNIRRMADRLAAEGYVVLAADLYGGQSAESPEAAQPLMRAALAKPKVLDANIDAAYAYLEGTAHASRVAVLGWCFGGGVAFQAAKLLGDKLSATVIYYGSIDAKRESLAKIKAPVLGLFGGKDESIPATTIAAFAAGLEAQGARPIVRVYPESGHAFANPSGLGYRKDDAEDAWRRTLDFLGENLQRPGPAGDAATKPG